MRRKIIGLLFGLALALSLSTAYAAAGDAKVRVYLQGGGGTPLLTCTPANSPCAINLTGNSTYIFTLTEITSPDYTPYRIGVLDLNMGASADFTNRTYGAGYYISCPGSPPTVAYTDSGGIWKLDLRSTTTDNCLAYQSLIGKAVSGQSGQMFVRLVRQGYTESNIRIDFTTP